MSERRGELARFLNVAVFHSVAYQEALLAGSEGGPRNAISERVAISPQVISEISIDRLRSALSGGPITLAENVEATREGLIKKYLQSHVITRRTCRVSEKK